MKWGLQHVKVTLEESDSGETVVIEQSSDGRVTCEPGKAGKRERAANAAPARAAETKTQAPAEQPRPPKTARKRGGDEPQPKSATKAAAPQSKSAAKSGPKTTTPERRTGPKTGRRTSLEWAPVKDHDYNGFAARSAAGQFKVLRTKGSQWALFYELKGTWPKNLGCFGKKLEKAKERAQELHDAGWPESEFGPITAGQVARACPVSGTEDATETPSEEKHVMTPPKPSPKEAKQPAPEPDPKPSKTEAAKDDELLSSFAGELDTVLDEDEDD